MPEVHSDPASPTLEDLLELSTDLQDALMDAIGMDDTFELQVAAYGAQTAFLAAELSLEHASGLRTLLATGHPRSATAVMRMQYEAVVRSAWAVWAATDAEIDLLEQDLSLTSEAAAKQVGQHAAMQAALAGSKCPPVLLNQLREFSAVSWRSLNSFIHGGIHALKRGEEGFPLALAVQVLQSSNGLASIAAALMATLGGNSHGHAAINELAPRFAACLPAFKPVASTAG